MLVTENRERNGNETNRENSVLERLHQESRKTRKSH